MSPSPSHCFSRLSTAILTRRALILAAAAAISLLLTLGIPRLGLDVAFDKAMPSRHPYTDVLRQYATQFGNRDELLIALVAEQGDIFTADQFARLETLTNEVFFLPGIDRTRVSSLFTPNVRFTEVIAGGFAGGPVLPSDFTPTPAMLQQVRSNAAKSEQARHLLSADGRAALVRAELLPSDPATGAAVDYLAVAAELHRIKESYSDGRARVEIVGFAALMGEIAAATQEVLGFLLLTVCAMGVILYLALGSIQVALLPIACSAVALLWLLGVMGWLSLGLNPMGVLVPFLVMAIGVSHGVQVTTAWLHDYRVSGGASAAARSALERVLLPGTLSLLTDCIGFATLFFINIPVIRELALTATLGVAFLLLSNLVLLPCMLAYVHPGHAANAQRTRPFALLRALTAERSPGASRRHAKIITLLALVLALAAAPAALRVDIGDVEKGAAELHANSVYNRALKHVAQLFSAGIDTLVVYAEVGADGCIDFATMQKLDDFVAALRALPEVLSVRSLTEVAKVNNAGWHEGSLKWRALPRESSALSEVTAPVETSSGLLNHDCSVLPVYVDTIDHTSTTLHAVLTRIENFQPTLADSRLKLHLAGGNLGVSAATNEVVAAARLPVLMTLYAALFMMCIVGFRSLSAGICIILPLALVSLLCYAFMDTLNIGLTLYTLPVVAVGAGIGVDYSFYLFSQYRRRINGISESERQTQASAQLQSIVAVLVTALTLSAGVLPWALSGLKYQADMGILLGFLFVVNMAAAILLMPALLTLVSRAKG
jgi:predicted RND superfamily exporter protein